MKTLKLTFIIISTIFLIIMMVSCNKENSNLKLDEIPAEVQNTFQKDYSGVKNVNWEKDGDYFEAEYDKNGMEQTVLYDNKGNILRTENEIAIKDIPLRIHNYVADNFGRYKIVDAAIMEKSDGSFYKVEINKGSSEMEFLFDMDGAFVSEDIDDTDEDETEDDDN